jgi:CHASE2 domain-containing sensor protein
MENFLETYSDLIAIGFASVGALIKAVKMKYSFVTSLLSMVVAGIMTWGATALIELWFIDLNPKIIALIAFCIGWVSNELTKKLDELVDDIYDVAISWLKSKLSK